jgi:polyisoprenoid-binding protein YceI
MKTSAHFHLTYLAGLVCFLAGLIISPALSAQQVYKIGPETSIQVDGTSSLHDWTCKVETFAGEGKFSLEGNMLTEITGLKISLAANSLKSGKGAMMDKNTYKALKADEFPQIVYELQGTKVLPGGKVSTTGKLTIAGVSKVVKMEVNYQVNAGKVTVKGALPILMREYKIDPPTAMMGTIKTGEEVTVVFHAVFAAAKELSAL